MFSPLGTATGIVIEPTHTYTNVTAGEGAWGRVSRAIVVTLAGIRLRWLL